MITRCLLLSIPTALVVWFAAATKPTFAQQPDAVLRFTVHPAGAPDPTLKYQLLPPLIDRRPENAAVWYGKVTAEQTPFFSDKTIWENISDWAALPLEDVRSNERLQRVTRDNPIFMHLERGARSEHVDWQLPIRDDPFYSILLPEVQQTRTFARLLVVRVRRQVAAGDFEGAIRTLQSGYGMARHVAHGPTLINALVGFAESNMMSQQLRDFIQQPEAPNLYWALTALPEPLVDMRPGVEAELAAAELTFPALQELNRAEYGEQYWREQLEDFWETTSEYTDNSPEGPWMLLALTVRGYPLAKKGLIESGWSQEQVDSMPVAQVVLVYSMMQYERSRDEQMKWLFVPYPLANSPRVLGGEKPHDGESRNEDILPLGKAFIPGAETFRYAAAASQREIALLRLIEAIRLYGARHEGQPPPSLEALAEVPIPVDPINGKPFEYRLEQQTAIIEGPPRAPAGMPPLRVEVQFAEPQSE